MSDFVRGLPTSRAGWLAVLAVHAVLVAFYYAAGTKHPLGDERMYRHAAERVLSAGDSGLGSFWPPFYAWFLAPLMAAAGGSLWLVQTVQTLLLAVSAWLLRRLVTRWLDDGRAGDLAFFLTLAYPPLAAFAHYLWPEVLHLALMLGALTLLTESRGRSVPVVVGGLLLALCLQTKVLLLPLLPPLALGLVASWPRPRRGLAALCLGITVLGGLAPTLAAQRRDFGRPMLADSGWFNAWVGLNEVSATEFRDSVVVEEYSRYRQSARSAEARARIARDKISVLLRERGPLATLRHQVPRQYFRLFNRESFLTHQLAGGVIHDRGGGYAAAAPLASRLLRGVSFAAWGALLVAFGLGVAIFPYRRRPVGWWVLGYLVMHCALFLVLHVKSRYRVQMLPAILFFAVYTLAWWRARRRGEGSGRRLVRWVAGSVLVAALLYLAFAPAWRQREPPSASGASSAVASPSAGSFALARMIGVNCSRTPCSEMLST